VHIENKVDEGMEEIEDYENEMKKIA